MKEARRLRVLHVGKFYPPHMGGIETHLQTLCRALQTFHDVEVLVANDGPDDEETWDEEIKVTRAGTLFKVSSASVCRGMVHRIGLAKADIIQMHLPNPSAVLACLAAGHKARFIATYHSDVVRQRVLNTIFEPFQRHFLKRCTAIIATSARYLETSPTLQALKERCRVVPYGIHYERFDTADVEAVRAIKAQYGARLVISVGRLIYYKGFEVLIRAMKGVRGKLLLLGDGPLRDNLVTLAKEQGVLGKVVFLGEVQNEETIPFYHAADVFALASIARSEAFGIVQLEAMACGIPIVNTQLASGVPFVSLDGVTGLTVPPNDEKTLGAAINCLLDDDALRARYGRAGKERVRNEFSVETMTSRMLKLYEEVTS